MLAASPRTNAAPAPRRARTGRAAVRKADQVAADLMRRIVAQELAVGATLPRESELAERYEVNRSVVREAVKLLEVHRLVRPVRRRGTEVLDPMGSMSPEVLRAMLVPRPGVLDRAMLSGLLEVRAQLDVQMSALAAARRTPADLAALEAALEALRGLLADPERYLAASLEVPLVLARATQNPVFVMLAHWNRAIAADLDDAFRLARPPVEAHLKGVELLVDLVRKRDVEGVRSIIGAFHAWASPRILAAADLSHGASAAAYPVSLPPAAGPPARGARAGRKTPNRAGRGASTTKGRGR